MVVKGDLDSSRGFWKGLGEGMCPGMGKEGQGVKLPGGLELFWHEEDKSSP